MGQIFILSLVVIIILGMAVYAFLASSPALPENVQEIINKVKSSELPALVYGETGYVSNGGVKIWYERLDAKDDSKGTILLIMGLATTAINFTQKFCSPLLEAGYHVIRYDNRGVGESDWMKNWSKATAYTLDEMVADRMAVLKQLKIEKVHVVGVSMGGMIAQQMAIKFPNRILSLCSIMSSGYMLDPSLPKVPSSFVRNIYKIGIKYLIRPTEENIMKFAWGMMELLKGKGDYINDAHAIMELALYELRERNGFNPKAADQHARAIELSGSRYAELVNLELPTLVIHGTDDPLVLPAHAKKYQPMLKNSKMLWLDGVGHDLPIKYLPAIHEAILLNVRFSS